MNDFTWNLGGCRGGGGGGATIFFHGEQDQHELCESHSVSNHCLVEGSYVGAADATPPLHPPAVHVTSFTR